MSKVSHVTVHYIDDEGGECSFNVHQPDEKDNGSENALKKRLLDLASELYELHAGMVVCRE